VFIFVVAEKAMAIADKAIADGICGNSLLA